MYDELIKNLRYDSASALQNCEFDFVYDWMLEAADAIEDLQKQLDEETEYATALACNVPRWIPVTERLPVYGEKCLVVRKLHSHNDIRIDVSYCYVQREGFWSDNGRDWHVTHWMPLPQPPKEG